MSLVISIIALLVVAFSTGINIFLWLERLLGRRKVEQLSDDEKRRLEDKAKEEQRALDAFRSYDGYEDFK